MWAGYGDNLCAREADQGVLQSLLVVGQMGPACVCAGIRSGTHIFLINSMNF